MSPGADRHAEPWNRYTNISYKSSFWYFILQPQSHDEDKHFSEAARTDPLWCSSGGSEERKLLRLWKDDVLYLPTGLETEVNILLSHKSSWNPKWDKYYYGSFTLHTMSNKNRLFNTAAWGTDLFCPLAHDCDTACVKTRRST